MTGSAITFTETYTASGSVKKIKAAWTSDSATGAVTSATTKYYDGKLIGAITVPAPSSTVPSNAYDIAVYDSDSVDVALGALTNRDNVATEYVNTLLMAAVASSLLTITVTNAGNSKTGTLYLYIR